MQTLYLKYRPQRISELDLVSAREMLSKILESKNIPHAFLFSGPRGVGKTSSARIVAKSINCTNLQKNEPCNECDTCRSIMSGSAVDIVEIDAASNRGIDEIRELREKVKLAPMGAKYKVYIIDEVHMLTTEAANALLKTLEEPPAGVLFMLCTTEPEKLPDTVVSRCTQIKFKKPNTQEAVDSLKRVIEGEKIKADEGALKLVAAMAGGSFRDGTKILEQVILSQGSLTEENVKKVMGMLGGDEQKQFIELIRKGDSGGAIRFLGEIVNQGINLRGFVEMCVKFLREELMEIINTPKSKGAKLEETLKLIEDFEKAYERMRQSVVPQLPLEVLAIARGTKNLIEEEMVVADVAPEPIPVVTVVETKIVKEEIVAKVEKSVEVATLTKVPSGKGKYSLDDVASKWPDVLKAVKPKNHSVEALLKSTKPADFDGEKLTLEVFYKFHKDKLETEKCRKVVEVSVAEVFGVAPVKLYLKMGQKQSIKHEEITAEGVGEDIIKAAEEIFKVEAI